MITCDVKCPNCNEDVTIEPVTFQGNTPETGYCPKCGALLKFGEMYLKSFRPESITKEQSDAEVTIKYD